MGRVFVNVRDPEFGAVPGEAGRATCSDAFQRAVDALDENLGGVVFVPADPLPYEFLRSVIVDRDKVRIHGENRLTSQLKSVGATAPLTFGVKRVVGNRPLGDGHWADLSGMLDGSVTDQRWGCRSRVPSPVAGQPPTEATVTFPCSPFQFGPATGNYWSDVRQLTLDFIVRNDAMPWAGQPLFGLSDAFFEPSPFYAFVSAAASPPSVVFRFRTDDGLLRELRIPFDPTRAVLRCSFQLDLAARTVTAWVNLHEETKREQVTPDLALINDGWTDASRTLRFVPNWYAPFRLAAVGPNENDWGGGGQLPGSGGPVDLTFGALRFSDILRYRVLENGDPQQDANGAVDDRRWLTVEDHVFGALTMRDPVHKSAAGVPDLQILWEARQVSGSAVFNASGHGFFIPAVGNQYMLRNGCEKLNIKGFSLAPFPMNYGQAIGLGLVYGFTLDDMLVEFGAQGLSSFHLGTTYPVELRSCQFDHQTDCSIYAFFQNGRGDNVGLNYYGRSALKALRADLAYRNVTCTDSDVCESVVKLFQSPARLDNWLIDFERFTQSLPRDSYVWASIADDIGGPTQLVVRDCVGGMSGDEHTVAVRLVSNERGAGLPDSARAAGGWCGIERSFNSHADLRMRSLVAVDGPLWQGLFEGVPPRTMPLVANTAAPGASARIGTRSVPPPVSVPLPSASDDLVRALPGLIGYYRAEDAVIVPGPVVTRLVDRSDAHNDGDAVGNPAFYDNTAANGRPALRFVGGHYAFPALRGTTGAATLFFVAQRFPLFDSAPGVRGSLRTPGPAWQLDFQLTSRCAESDTDWAVYAVRCTAGPERRLQTYANGYPYELRRDDRVRTVVWSGPTLGQGVPALTPPWLLATAVICDAALDDRQVTDVCRYLLYRYRIPV
ncbi:hypothetical protein [Streptomyces luteireticuli]|uniref:Uncharacterized protein n=1 Tax=Streptomyces luteireticuli TaxID=173858 RepID=A0ABN0YX05_9ACTN